MVTRQRTQAVRGQELVLVEDAVQHPEPVTGRDHAQHQMVIGQVRQHLTDPALALGTESLAQGFEALAHGLQRAQRLRPEDNRGQQRQDTHDGTRPDRDLLALRGGEDVVEEAVLVIPKPL